MWELKEMFDPEYVLNPGVILNKASRAFTLLRWAEPAVRVCSVAAPRPGPSVAGQELSTAAAAHCPAAPAGPQGARQESEALAGG